MMKKWTIATAAAALVLTAAIPAFAADVTAQDARATANKVVPTGSIFKHTEDDGIKYEVQYYHSEKREDYEVDVSKSTGKVIAFDSELFNDDGSRSVTLTQKDAEKKVTNEIKGADILYAGLHTDDGLKVYEIRFESDTCYGTMEIHPATGAILSRDIKIGTAPDSQTLKNLISYDEARDKTLKQIPGAYVKDIDLDYEDGGYIYKVKLVKDGVKQTVKISAKTGSVTDKKSSEEATSGDIGLQEAKRIAQAKAPNAVITKSKADHDDGRKIYEIELRDGSWEYDCEIDAATGNILEWDQDYDD